MKKYRVQILKKNLMNKYLISLSVKLKHTTFSFYDQNINFFTYFNIKN